MRIFARLLKIIFILSIPILRVSGSPSEETKQKPSISLEDFFRNPTSQKFQLSPNGEWLAFLQPYKNTLPLLEPSGDERGCLLDGHGDRQEGLVDPLHVES
ncbi:MAG: hypothetical protein KDD35_05020, partial [Bdellovibrionales bacterium]|nr:hypothetical protein [Bdellovibrionales bacterium]